MTVNSTTNRVSYNRNGTTAPLAVNFPFQAQSDLKVVETVIATGVQTTKVLNSDYTITGTPDANGWYSSGGSVVPVAANTNRWTIIRDPSPTQTVQHVDNDPLPAASIDGPLDKLTMIVQRHKDRLDRGISIPDGDAAMSTVLPSSVARASKVLAFDGSGLPVASTKTLAEIEAGALAVATTVTNLAALKALPATASYVGSVIGMLCHTTVGDGGEGLFRITQSAPHAADEGVVVALTATGYYAVRLFSGTAVRPEWWGVSGVAAVDLAAFNSAEAYLNTYLGGGAILCGPKDYLNGGWKCTSDKITVIGTRRTTFKATANSQDVITLSASNCSFTGFTIDAGSFTDVTGFALVPEDEAAADVGASQDFNEIEFRMLGGAIGLRMRAGPGAVPGYGDSTCYWNDIKVTTINTVFSVWSMANSPAGGGSGANANFIRIIQVNLGGVCQYGYVADAGSENTLYRSSFNGVNGGVGPKAIWMKGGAACANNNIRDCRFEGNTNDITTTSGVTGLVMVGNKGILNTAFHANGLPIYADTDNPSGMPAFTVHSVLMAGSQVAGYDNNILEELYETRFWDLPYNAGGSPRVRLGKNGIHNLGQTAVGGLGGVSNNFVFAVPYAQQQKLRVNVVAFDSGASPSTVNGHYSQEFCEQASGTFDSTSLPGYSHTDGTPDTFTVTTTRLNANQIQVAVVFAKSGGVAQGTARCTIDGVVGGVG